MGYYTYRNRKPPQDYGGSYYVVVEEDESGVIHFLSRLLSTEDDARKAQKLYPDSRIAVMSESEFKYRKNSGNMQYLGRRQNYGPIRYLKGE